MAQFLPSFDESTTTTGGNIGYTNDPEDLESDDEEASADGKKLAFSFIVDRSGSMHGMSIELVKEALQLFMQSLPSGCKFQITSFGSGFQRMFKTDFLEYNDKNKQTAIDQIGDFDADFGGTEMLGPVEDSFKSEQGNGIQKRIFLLTDGQTRDSDKVINTIKNHC